MYKNLFYCEKSQKVAFDKKAPYKDYYHVGKLSENEFNLLLEVLIEVYGEKDINLNEFRFSYHNIRHFCDSQKNLLF